MNSLPSPHAMPSFSVIAAVWLMEGLAQYSGRFKIRNDDAMVMAVQWDWSISQPAKNKNGIHGWVRQGHDDGPVRIHICAHTPCRAVHRPSTYIYFPVPLHVQFVERLGDENHGSGHGNDFGDVNHGSGHGSGHGDDNHGSGHGSIDAIPPLAPPPVPPSMPPRGTLRGAPAAEPIGRDFRPPRPTLQEQIQKALEYHSDSDADDGCEVVATAGSLADVAEDDLCGSFAAAHGDCEAKGSQESALPKDAPGSITEEEIERLLNPPTDPTGPTVVGEACGSAVELIRDAPMQVIHEDN